MPSFQEISDRFYHTFYTKKCDDPDRIDLSPLSIDQSYQVQDRVAKRRVDVGETVVGYKVGCTSPAIRAQFGLSDPICGRLFRPHVVDEGARLDWSSYANCAIEPEMVLCIGKDIDGTHTSDADLRDSIESVSPGVEVHDYTFWHGEPTAQELICSGGIHAGLVIGKSRVSPASLSFQDELFSVFLDQDLVASQPANEIMGGPLHSLRWLVRFLAGRGEILRKGSFVIPGSPTELIPIDQDRHVRVAINDVGEIVVPFESEGSK